MNLNEIPAWNEIESQPWFASLTPEEKQQSLQKWQGDMMQFAKDPKEKFAVAATSKAKARSFFGEEMPDDPIADALQRRQKDLEDIGSRYDAFSKGELEEDDEEVLTLNDTLKGNTPYSVIKGRLFVSPQLVWDKAAYEKVVNEAPVDEDERVLAMSAYDGSKERAAEGVVNSLGYTDEEFRDFAAKGFKEGKSNAAILDEWKANNKLPEGILGSLRGVGRQAYFGLRSGLSGLERAMGGLGGFFGSESAQKYAEESGKEAQSYMQRTLGEGPEFIGELTSGAVSIIPTMAAGAAASFFTEGAALPAAASITAGAIQSAGATQAETYEFYRNQGLDHANALAESRVDGLVSGLITGAITHYAGKLGDKIGLGKGIEGLFSGPASKIASKLTQREISESLKAGAKAVGGSFLQEGSEELLDQAAQDAYSMIKRDPTLTLAEAINNALQAGKVGAVLGGAAEAGKIGLNSLLNSAKFSVPTTEEEEALRAKFEVPAAVEEEVIASPEVQQKEQNVKTAADVVKETAPVAPQTAAVLAGITEEKVGELAADVVVKTGDALATIEAEAPVVATEPPAGEAPPPAEAPAISPKPPVSPAVEPAPIGETQPPAAASMPMMVTREMNQQLADLGYSRKERNALRPEQAAAIIAGGVRKEKPVSSQPPQGKPIETPTNAAPEITLEESLRQEPQDRVEVGTPEETGAGDSVQRAAEGEKEVAPQRILTAQEEFLASKGVTDTNKLPQRRRQALEKEYQKWLKERGGAFRLTLPEQRGGGNLILSDWKQAYPLLPEDLKTDLLRAVVNNRGRTATEQDVADVMAFAEELVSQRPADERILNESNLFYDISANRSATPEIKARAQRRYEEAQGLQPSPPTTGAVPTKTLPAGQKVTPRGVASPGVAAEAQPEQPDAEWAVLSPTQWASTVGKAVFESRLGKKLTKKQAADFVEATRKGETVHKLSVEDAVTRYRNPVSSEAVDAYGIKLPEGYVKQGELYVYEKTQPLSKGDAAGERGAVAPAPTVEPAPEARPEQPSVKATPEGKRSLYQIRAAEGRSATDADGAPTGWKLNEFRDAIELVSEDASKYIVFPLENPSSYGDKLRALATAENWAIDNPVRAQIEAAPMEANYGAGRVEDVTPKTVKFVHTTKTTPGKGQKSGYYPGTYAYESESGLLPSMKGNKFVGELPESGIYTLKDADQLKKDAADAGFGKHSGNGNAEVKYLQSLGFKAMRRPAMGGTEIIVFDAKDANFQPAPEAQPVSQPVQAFRNAVSQMSPTAQAKWTPELRATAEAYLDSGGTTGLQGLNPTQEKIIKRILDEATRTPEQEEAIRKADAEKLRQAKAKEKAERARESAYRESSLPPTPGKQIRKIGKGAMESVPVVLDEIAKVIPNIRDLVEVRESVEGEPGAEGFYDPQADKAVVLVDNVYLKPQHGGSQEAALRETIIHELLHRGFAKLRQTNPQLFEQFEAYSLADTNDAQFEALVRRGYSMYSNWKDDPAQNQKAREEIFIRKAVVDLNFKGIEAIKSPTSLASQFFKWFKEFLSKLLGRVPSDNQLIHWAQIFLNAAQAEMGGTQGDRMLSVGRDLLSPEKYARHAELEAKHNAGTITPEETAEAQALVDEAAKRAGFNVSGVGNGVTYEAGDEPDSVYGERDNVMSHGGTFGFYFSDNPDVWSDYAKPRRKGEKGRVNRTFLALKNPFRFSKEFVSYDELQTLLRDGGIALPAEVKSRLDRLVAGGFGDTQPVWKWLHPTHVGAGASYGESLKKAFTDAGYDGVIHPDSSLMEGGLDIPATSYVAFLPSQIKSADPFTGVPLEQRFGPSPDIRYSLADKDAEYLDAVEAGDSGNDNLSELLREASPSERQAVVDSWIKRNPKAAARMQQAVEEAAKAAGFNVRPVYHGTPLGPFNSFAQDMKGRATNAASARLAFWTTDSREVASSYAGGKSNAELLAEAKSALSSLQSPTFREKLKKPMVGWGKLVHSEQDLVEAESRAAQKVAELEARQEQLGPTVFRLYTRLENPRVVDLRPTQGQWSEGQLVRELQTAAQNGNDGVWFKGIDDSTTFFGMPSDHFAVFHAEQLKSADPVTYDDAGNVIPPSQRFQTVSPDIRYSLGEPPDMQAEADALREVTPSSQALDKFRETFGTPRQDVGQVLGKKEGSVYTQAQVAPLSQHARNVIGFEVNEEGDPVVNPKATQKALDLVSKLLNTKGYASRFNTQAAKLFEGTPVDPEIATAVLTQELQAYANRLSASSPKAEDQILKAALTPFYNTVILGNYLTLRTAGRALQAAGRVSNMDDARKSREEAEKAVNKEITKQLGDEALPAAEGMDKAGVEGGVDAIKDDIPAPADPTLRLLDLAVESLDEVAKAKTERVFDILFEIGQLEELVAQDEKVGNKAMSILRNPNLAARNYPTDPAERKALLAQKKAELATALDEALASLQGAKPETRKKVKAKAAKTKSKTDSIQKLIDKLSKMPDESKEAKPKAETLRAAIADAIKEKEFDEQKVRDAAAKFGATPEQTERLVEEAERIHEIRQSPKLSKAKLRQFLLSFPKNVLANPEQREALLRSFLKGQNYSEAEINRIVPQVLRDFDTGYQKARKAYLDELEKKLKPKQGQKESKQDQQNRKMLNALRSGLADTTSEASVALAKSLGFEAFRPQDDHILSKLDEEMRKLREQGRLSDSNAKFDAIKSLLIRRRPPRGFGEVVAQSWITSALSSLSNLAVNVWAPMGEAGVRLMSDIVRATALGKFDEIPLYFEAAGKAMKGTLSRFNFAVKTDTFTNSVNTLIAGMASMKDEMQRSAAVLKDKNASPAAKANAGLRYAMSFGDYSRRILSSIDDTWYTALSSYVGSSNLIKLLGDAKMPKKAVEAIVFHANNDALNQARAEYETLQAVEQFIEAMRGKTNEEIDAGFEYLGLNDASVTKEQANYIQELISAFQSLRLRSGATGDELIKRALKELRNFRASVSVRATELGQMRTKELVREALSDTQTPAQVEEAIKEFDENAKKAASFGMGLHRVEGVPPYDILGNMFGIVDAMGRQAVQKSPLLGRMIVGFFGIPLNLLNRAVWFTPYGLGRYFLAKWQMAKNPEEKFYEYSMASQRERTMRFTEAAVGTSMTMLLYALGVARDSDDKEDEGFYITLGGPSNKTEYDAWYARGFRKFSICYKTKSGSVVSVPYGRGTGEVLKGPLMLLGAFDDMRLNKKLGDREDMSSVIEYLNAAAAGIGKQATFLGAKNTAGAFFSEQFGTSTASNLAYSAANLIPFNGLDRSISALALGPPDRSRTGAIWANIPIVRHLAHQPAINVFGDPWGNKSESALNQLWDRQWNLGLLPLNISAPLTGNQKRLYNFIGERLMGPSDPLRGALELRNGYLTDEEFYRYKQYRGKQMAQTWLTDLDRWRKLDDDSLSKAIAELSTKATKKAKDRFNYK